MGDGRGDGSKAAGRDLYGPTSRLGLCYAKETRDASAGSGVPHAAGSLDDARRSKVLAWRMEGR